MTYTVAFRDYHAPTMGEAAEHMLFDADVWVLEADVEELGEPIRAFKGEQAGYALDHWEWTPGLGGANGTLRCWFR